jgi:ribosomal-protein-alanine N-acetyltransferase
MIQIKKMIEADILFAAELEALIFSIPWSEKSFLESIRNTDCCFYAAWDGERLIGYAGAYLAADVADIVNVAVHPEYRCLGVGKLLLSALIDECIMRGVTGIGLEVRAGNEPAISLYRGFGFEQNGLRRGFYEKPTEDARLMWKVISRE